MSQYNNGKWGFKDPKDGPDCTWVLIPEEKQLWLFIEGTNSKRDAWENLMAYPTDKSYHPIWREYALGIMINIENLLGDEISDYYFRIIAYSHGGATGEILGDLLVEAGVLVSYITIWKYDSPKGKTNGKFAEGMLVSHIITRGDLIHLLPLLWFRNRNETRLRVGKPDLNPYRAHMRGWELYKNRKKRFGL